jgi:Exostosin family
VLKTKAAAVVHPLHLIRCLTRHEMDDEHPEGYWWLEWSLIFNYGVYTIIDDHSILSTYRTNLVPTKDAPLTSINKTAALLLLAEQAFIAGPVDSGSDKEGAEIDLDFLLFEAAPWEEDKAVQDDNDDDESVPNSVPLIVPKQTDDHHHQQIMSSPGCDRVIVTPLFGRSDMDIGLSGRRYHGGRLSQEQYNDRMSTSDYCLVMCGDTPTSRSLISAMTAGCIPILIGRWWHGFCDPPCHQGRGVEYCQTTAFPIC